MTLQDKVIAGLEKTADSCGHKLEIEVTKREGSWVIVFKAGKAAVWMKISTFVTQPKITLDPFVEECIKKNL